MEKLSSIKKLSIVRQYLSGQSYDEIRAKSGISKGTVANIVMELRAGRFPEAADTAEHIELMRELSLDLKRLGLTPGQCATGLIVLTRINQCGLDPADIDRWPLILKSVRNRDEAQEFIRVVYSIQEVQKRTHLSLDALDNKVHELERRAAELEPMTGKLEDCKKQVAELTRQHKELTAMVANLEEKHKLLTPQVKDLEKREQDLSRRIKDTEPKAQKAETTLSTLNTEMQRLQDLGIRYEELAELNQRLQEIAHRHAVKPAELKNRLLHELENLDEGVGLEALIQSRQLELDKMKEAIAKTQKELETTKAVVRSLEQEKAKLEASIKETREKVGSEIAKIPQLARDTINQLVGELGHGLNGVVAEVDQLKEKVLEVGKEVGRYEGILEVNQWLNELLALVRGEETVEGQRVRVIALLVIRDVALWLKRHSSESTILSLLSTETDRLVRELEQWKI